MKILIPMAGKGRRFDGFLSPKPLVRVDGRPIIEHAIRPFPRTSDFIFVCHEDHLETTDLREVLTRIAPHSHIVSVGDEMLHGPAYSSIPALDMIDDDEEVIVSYCDTVQRLDYNKFMEMIRARKPDGALVTFRGFHPASLGNVYYAYVKVDDNGWATALREKKSFSLDRTLDFASTGVHYFSSGEVFKRYLNKLVNDPSEAVNGEFYVSLIHKLMIEDGCHLANFEVDKFISLGIPRDYELYKFWSELFADQGTDQLSFDNINLNVTNIFPLAGGERDFSGIGYEGPNYMLPVMGKTLLEHAYRSNPRGIKTIFIGLDTESTHLERLDITTGYNAEIVYQHGKRNGNADTISIVKDRIAMESPVGVCGATQISRFNVRRLSFLMEKEDIDIILFAFTHHEAMIREPNQFAYARLTNNIEVKDIVEKQPISDNPYGDHALTATANYKRARHIYEPI
ncbi:MAG: NTP transferase domain-containing protein [Spirochaeta sp.]|nr:NTP transferase domain-containing protein [Spirochaeta sp.]